jgi:hypothetical protein
VQRAKTVLSGLIGGNPGFEPEYFDRVMTELGLAPEDIGTTSEAVAAAKRRWRIERAKSVLNWMAAGNDAFDPEYFDRVMTGFGLTPEDIGTTTEQIAMVKRLWAERRAK